MIIASGVKQPENGHTRAMVRAVAAIALIVGTLAIPVAGGAPDSTSKRTARIHLVSTVPVKVRGTGFVAGERVRVTAISEWRRVKRVVATRAGGFTAGFAGASYDRCNGLLVTAVGSEGSLARFKLPQPLCPPN